MYSSFKIIGSIIVLFATSLIYSQNISIRIYDAEQNITPNSIVNTYDGGYIISGEIEEDSNPSLPDAYVIKFDSTHFIQWAKALGPNRVAHSTLQCLDGGYISLSSPGVGLTKFNEQGTIEWFQTYGIGSISGFHGARIIATSDSGYAVVGKDFFSIGIMKLDFMGTVEWVKTIEGASYLNSSSLIELSDKSIIICGSNDSVGAGKSDIYIIKIDSAGKEIWTRSLGSTEYEYGIDVIAKNDSQIIVLGYNYNNENKIGTCIIKLDTAGNVLWDKLIRVANDSMSLKGNQIIPTEDNGYAIVGNGIVQDGFYSRNYTTLIKFNAQDSIQWFKIVNDSRFYSYSIIESPQNDFLLTGSTGSLAKGAMIFVMSMDSSGNICIPTIGDYIYQDLEATIDSGGVFVSPISSTNATGFFESFIIPNLEDGCSLTSTNTIFKENNILMYPNPAASAIYISLDKPLKDARVSIYNISGQEVLKINDLTDNSLLIERGDLPSGIYFLQLLQDEHIIFSEKIIFIK